MENNNKLKSLNSIINDSTLTFKKEKIFTSLFEQNNYKPMVDMYQKSIGKNVPNNIITEDITNVEKMIYKSLSKISGNIHIEVDSELSRKIISDDSKNIDADSITHIPFHCFTIDVKNFKMIEEVFVYKKDDNLYIHFQRVGKEQVSFQITIKNSLVLPQYTYSSLYYHRESFPISTTTQRLVENCLQYILKLLKYMTDFQKDRTVMVKDMKYDNYYNKLSDKQKNKTIFRNKLSEKKNTITLNFSKQKIVYVNSKSTGRKYKKVEEPFCVSGHYRNQPIGRREEKKYKQIWIPSFNKCLPSNDSVNNTFVSKVYNVS